MRSQGGLCQPSRSLPEFRSVATRHAHLVGIAGAGMRALAEVLRGQGWMLSGSDIAVDPRQCFAPRGVRVHQRHAAENVSAGTDLVVRSDAVPDDNPELRRAAELGIPVRSYFKMAGRLMAGRHGVAIAGTHGKSTTTAMAAHIIIEAGRDPTVLCGATPLGRSSGGRAGRGPLVLVEACEYRANFFHLRPAQAVILNIEPDHFDCYPNVEELEAAFARFARLVPPEGIVLARYECAARRRVTAGLTCHVETFGTLQGADWRAEVPGSRRGADSISIYYRGRPLCELALQVPGRHNVLNALAAAALAWHNGVPAAEIAAALESFRGLHRRLEVLGTCEEVMRIDDYAHHPTEVAAALETVRRMAPGRRVWCVFQPHQASRTAHLLDELAVSLQNADRVLVAEIFRAREGPPRPGEVTAADLACRARGYGAAVEPVHGTAEIAEVLRTHLAPGDVLITLGAGDIRKIHDRLS